MKFEVPGKTYLVGEYSVLLGGSAIGLATNPCFEINYDPNSKKNEQVQFHPESPAALYLAQYQKTIRATIKDPYIQGGFGRSTAEYWSAIVPDLLKKELSFNDILTEYKKLHSGSGIDLAFQYFGNICLADPLIQFYQTFNWHFENLDFFIISTGKKIATHDHLKNLDLKILKDLPVLSNRITQVFAENKEFEFLSLMKQWCAKLQELGLTHPNSIELRGLLESCDSIKLAKPSGALGADVIIVFFAKSHRETVKNFLFQNNIQMQAHSNDLAIGISSQLDALRAEYLKSEQDALAGQVR